MDTLLFSPYSIQGVTLKNRIVMSPMCMYSSFNKDGKVTNFHLTHYSSRAIGQVGLILIEATAVTPQGRISNEDLGIWEDSHIEGLSQIVQSVKESGSKIGIQLAHAGRKSMADGPIIAPSPIAFHEKMKTPNEMTNTEIIATVQAFKDGAARAKKAGFDIIEIHGAHGYLINQFLSPLTNKRSDTYGGSNENRYRFLKEVISAIKEVWEGPLFVRLSANEYVEGGNLLSTFIEYSTWMKEQGVDLIDCSSGGVVHTQINPYPGYQVHLSETIRNNAEIATGAVGLITSPTHAEEILQNKRADLIFLGRELLRNPYWPRNAAIELGVTIPPPKQYERGWNM